MIFNGRCFWLGEVICHSEPAVCSVTEHRWRSRSYGSCRGRDVISVWAHVIFWQRRPDVIALAADRRQVSESAALSQRRPILRRTNVEPVTAAPPAPQRHVWPSINLTANGGSRITPRGRRPPVRSRADNQSDARLSHYRSEEEDEERRRNKETHAGGFSKGSHHYGFAPITISTN